MPVVTILESLLVRWEESQAWTGRAGLQVSKCSRTELRSESETHYSLHLVLNFAETLELSKHNASLLVNF